MGRMEKLPGEMPELPREMVDDIDDDDADLAANKALWEEEIRLRMEEIRNGTAELYDLEDVLAEMEERYEADDSVSSADEDLKDPADVETAWAEEIKQRIDEVRAGTVRTYAAEDVMAMLRLRFG